MNACKQYLIFEEEEEEDDNFICEETGTGCYYVSATGIKISLPDLRRY